MKFRLIPTQEFSACKNMAVDEAIMEQVREGESPPTIRLYTWKPSAVSIGYFQGLKNEVDEEKCKKEKVDIVRRMTGGGAVYHDSKGEITYSIIGPENLFPKSIKESYKHICGHIVEGLQELGLEAEFSPINDILVKGKKISGSAQTRKKGVLLQHGTILYMTDVDKMFSLLKVGKEKISDKLIKSVKKRVTSIKSETTATKKQLALALEKAFSNNYDLFVGEYSDSELQRAEELKDKYESEEWTAMR